MSYTKIRVMGQPDEVRAVTYVITMALDEHHLDSMKAFQIGQELASENICVVHRHSEDDNIK